MEPFLVFPYFLELFLAIGAFWAYYSFVSPFTYWKKRGVPQVEVTPIIGNMLKRFRMSLLEFTKEGYDLFPESKIVGNYQFWKPTLTVKDPDLIDAILIKDFSHFVNRANQGDPKSFLAKHLLNMTDNHWKIIRSKLNPTFSSGKLKGMHPQLVDCGNSLMKFMEQFEKGESFDARNVIQRFTMDVIASCAFGLNIDTINDPDNEFRKMGMSIFTPTLAGKLQLIFRYRKFLVALGLDKLFSQTRKFTEYFVQVLDQTMEYRKNNDVTRPDFLHLTRELMDKDVDKIKSGEITADDPTIFDHSTLASNAFVFFLAGFETTATTVSYAMYELALNPKAQDRLHSEIVSVLAQHEGIPDYTAIQDMPYLNQVVSETLRKYPPAFALSRLVTEDYHLPGTDLILPVGLGIRIPVYSLHHDSRYYPEPEQFIPERFDKSKNLIRKGTYLPFGDGPRMCIGARFAQIEAKLCLAMIVNKYKISRCDETPVPLTFNKNAFLLAPEKQLRLTISKR